MPSTDSAVRYRFRLSKQGPATSLSHLQQIRALKNALAASGLPVAMSASRRSLPKVSFGPALAEGHESRSEYLDVELSDKLGLDPARKKLADALPEGYALLEGRRIPVHYPSVESLSNIAVYLLKGAAPEAKVPAELFPILKLEAAPEGLRLEVKCGAKGAAHPERLVQAWTGWEGFSPTAVVREELWALAPNGERLTP